MTDVLVVGAGSMGSLFAALLSRVTETAIVTGWTQRAADLRRAGITLIEPDGSATTSFPRVLDELAGPGTEADFVLLCRKASDLEGTADQYSGARPRAFLTIQNGICHVAAVKRHISDARLVVGVTYQGAVPDGLRIRHGSNGPTYLWPQAPAATAAAEGLADLFRRAGIPAEVAPDGGLRLWEKLAVTCGINGVSASLGLSVSELRSSPSAVDLAVDAAVEVARLARSAGMEIADVAARDSVMRAIEHASSNVPSMLQDLRAGRTTEVEFINGHVCREAIQVGLETPVNAILHRLILAREETMVAESQRGNR